MLEFATSIKKEDRSLRKAYAKAAAADFSKSTAWTIRILAIVLFALGLLLFCTRVSEAMLIAAGCWIVAAIFIELVSRRGVVRSLGRTMDLPFDWKYSVADSGITMEGNGTKTFIEWTNITCWGFMGGKFFAITTLNDVILIDPRDKKGELEELVKNKMAETDICAAEGAGGVTESEDMLPLEIDDPVLSTNGNMPDAELITNIPEETAADNMAEDNGKAAEERQTDTSSVSDLASDDSDEGCNKTEE